MNARPGIADTVPRYTSYPTAPHFHPGIDHEAVSGWMGATARNEAISLYIHIPFCDRLCWFCACHTRHTLRYEPVAAYLGNLEREIGLVASLLPRDVPVSSLHLGGGSPTMLRPADLVRLVDRLRATFDVARDASLSIEIDPNDMDAARLDAMADVGITRASLGVQDFDPKVQKAINRIQTFDQTATVVEGLRARGISSINLDLVYGLPHQTAEGVAATVRQCLTLRPDRLATFGYAHVPWFKKHQTMIADAWLPDPEQRLAQARRASAVIVAEGYVPIGIDHFARPDDGLAKAAAGGTLRRNFQGYTDDRNETIVGLGPSSVSRYRNGYAQNATDMGAYLRAIEARLLPIARGIALTPEDRARAWVIERLMCDFRVSETALASLFPEMAPRLMAVVDALLARSGSGLATLDGDVVVEDAARPLVRSIASAFDAYLPTSTARHSAAV